MTYLSHSENAFGRPEALCDHLHLVSRRAEFYAHAIGAGGQARVAGLLHDLGKYSEQFQRRLRDPREPGKDHWTAGAAAVLRRYGEAGVPAALAILGHHTGLAELRPAAELARAIAKRLEHQGDELTEPDLAVLIRRFQADGFDLDGLGTRNLGAGSGVAGDMLDIRLLFSALVDADFIETEAHFNGDAVGPRYERPEAVALDPRRALAVIEERVTRLRRSVATAVQRVRDNLLQDCLVAAQGPTGLYTLSAPTGSGKTLAMLAFAMRHAAERDLRRIIIVLPFLNIIEQTADLCREVFSAAAGFPDGYIIEDHSLANVDGTAGDGQEARSRMRGLLAENWDAPLVVTTSVQCLESLMAARPGACRKLHRLARSVLLFDEVQTLPRELAPATLATLSRLAERFGSTIVFATATQPAFDHLDKPVGRLAPSGWRPREIVTDVPYLFRAAAGRVRVRWRLNEPAAWDVVADEMAELEQVLCIVNLKRHAVALAERLGGAAAVQRGLLHLSTSMCPRHRRLVLNCVRRRLKNGQPVRLVATQCVEAGVDLDFPVVYRALGPLESIAQAAGRCNRHGARPEGGVVHVFRPEEDGRPLYPPGGYAEAAETTLTFLNTLICQGVDLDGENIIQCPQRLRMYFTTLYDLSGIGGGVKARERDLADAMTAGIFPKVAELYRLIDKGGINILVPFSPRVFRSLYEELKSSKDRTPGWARRWIARARPHAVSIPRPRGEDLCWNRLQPVQFSRREEVDNDDAEWFVLLEATHYDRVLVGYAPKPEDLII